MKLKKLLNKSWFKHDTAYRNRIRIQWNTVRAKMRLKKMKEGWDGN